MIKWYMDMYYNIPGFDIKYIFFLTNAEMVNMGLPAELFMGDYRVRKSGSNQNSNRNEAKTVIMITSHLKGFSGMMPTSRTPRNPPISITGHKTRLTETDSKVIVSQMKI